MQAFLQQRAYEAKRKNNKEYIMMKYKLNQNAKQIAKYNDDKIAN